MKRKLIIILLFPVLLLVFSFFLCSPEEYFLKQVRGPADLKSNSEILGIKKAKDEIQERVTIAVPDVPPQDEIILQEDLHRAFVASMDGWIWIIDLKEKKGRPFVRIPLLPGGMAAHPKNRDILYFCVSRGKSDDKTDENGPGIYQLTISTKTIRKICTRVPLPPSHTEPGPGQVGVLYPDGYKKIKFSAMNPTNSRPVEKADDLAVSSDGERIYFTEPYDHPGAILGVSRQSRSEALTLGKNGHLWKYDLKEKTASLVAHHYSYLDGILLEYGKGEKEKSILVNELSRCRLLRFHLAGEKKGRDEVVIEGLPGFPDGMDRDSRGRIWIALVTERSGLLDWVHKNPFWKKFLLYVPNRLLPVSRKSGILVLSPDGRRPLYCTMHSGKLFSNTIVVVPGRERVYLAVYEKGYKGLNTMNYPKELVSR